MDNKTQSPLSMQAEFSALIHREAQKRDYIVNDAIMVERLSEIGEKYTADWLSDEEFSDTFKGNMVGYYLGICVNCLCGGLSCADVWADGDNRLEKIKYDEKQTKFTDDEIDFEHNIIGSLNEIEKKEVKKVLSRF